MSKAHPLYDVLAAGSPVQIPKAFLLERGAYGGIVLAAMVHEIGAVSAHPLRSLSVNLCGVTQCEVPSRVVVTPMRTGSKTASYSVEVYQGDQCTAHGAAFTGAARTDALDGQFCTKPALPPWASVAPLDTDRHMPPFARHFEYRPCHGGERFTGGAPITGGYINLHQGPATIDQVAMAALIDAWYPALFVSAEGMRPMATTAIQLLFFETEARLDGAPCVLTKNARRNQDGYGSEDAGLWSPTGRLLATAQQMIAVIR